MGHHIDLNGRLNGNLKSAVPVSSEATIHAEIHEQTPS
jgi:hypothetical protein